MHLSITVAAVGLSVLGSGCAPSARRGAATARTRSWLVGFTNFSRFTRKAGSSPGTTQFLSPEIAAPGAWDQLVVSWNAVAAANVGFKFEARGLYPDHRTRFYTLGLWSADPGAAPRQSVNGQGDADGDVRTDTLVLTRPGAGVQLRVTLERRDETRELPLKFLAVSFCNSRGHAAAVPRSDHRAWGTVLAVPQRSQLDYAGGRDWCSPTSVSMVLGYWAKRLRRPELDRNVPEIAAGVFDPQWPGTGNWPFNTAFAGALPGLRAYVARFSDISELEAWIADGVPVVVSVVPGLLHGRQELASTGHLVVCVGFTKRGDAVVNDPWAPREKGRRVRRICARRNLVAAWRPSLNTVYLIYPRTLKPPADPFGHWADN